MYKPVAAGHFDDAKVDITRTFATEIKVDKNNVVNDAAVCAFPLVQGGIVVGTDTDFMLGMPDAVGNPTGGAVTIGDVLVWNKVPYYIVSVVSATQLLVSAAPIISFETNASTDW